MPSKDHEWSEHLDGFSTHYGYPKFDLSHETRHTHLPALLWEVCQVPVLLVFIGICSALVSYALNYLVNFGNNYRWAMVTTIDDYHSWALYCLWSIVFSVFSCFFTRTICREAAGSGLPEMKTILSGTIKPVLLSFRLIVAKIGGLSLALIAGLSVGKEGPLVQVSGAIADQVMKFSLFRNIYRQDTRRLEIIACACASGVAATFGTSYGSVLFSIELTASAYLIRTLPKAFLASVIAMLVFFVLDVSDQLALFNEEIQSESFSPRWNELVAFLMIGVVSGILGVLFVYIVEFLSKWRNRFLDTKRFPLSVTAWRSYLLVAGVAGITAFFRYYECATVPQTGRGVHTLFDFLFQKNDMQPIMSQLIMYFFYKFLATALSVTLPLPVGLFTPVFLTGGVFGRICGEIITRYPHFNNYFAWEYSVLGAAGLATGVTRAMSTAVIVYELAGQPHLRLPLSIVVITAYFVGNRFSKMVYEVLIDTNGTPYMQEVPRFLYNEPVANVMLPLQSVHVLALDSTYQQAEELLRAMTNEAKPNQIQDKPPTSTPPSIDENKKNTTSQYNSLRSLSIDQPYLELTPLLSTGAASSTTKPSNASHSTIDAKNKGIAGNANRYLHKNINQRSKKFAQRFVKTQHYQANVIPIVKSKRNMVIVGAVLRSDLMRSVRELKRVIDIANTPPVILGRYEDLSFSEDTFPLSPSDSDDDSHRLRPSSIHPASINDATRQYQGNHTQTNTNYNRMTRDVYTHTSANEAKERDHGLHNVHSLSTDPETGLSSSSASLTKRVSFHYHDRPTETSEHTQQTYVGSSNAVHPLMLQTIQYVIVTNGGRSVVPVATNKHGMLVGSTLTPLSTLSSATTATLAVPLDPSPYQIVDTMQLHKVDLLFRMLSLNQAYVTHSGKLVGLVTRASLREFLGQFSKRPLDRLTQLAQACWVCCTAGVMSHMCGAGTDEEQEEEEDDENEDKDGHRRKRDYRAMDSVKDEEVYEVHSMYHSIDNIVAVENDNDPTSDQEGGGREHRATTRIEDIAFI